MQFMPSVTELVVAQCYYLDFDDRNRSKPIYVYLNSTGCINDKVRGCCEDSTAPPRNPTTPRAPF